MEKIIHELRETRQFINLMDRRLDEGKKLGKQNEIYLTQLINAHLEITCKLIDLQIEFHNSKRVAEVIRREHSRTDEGVTP